MLDTTRRDLRGGILSWFWSVGIFYFYRVDGRMNGWMDGMGEVFGSFGAEGV